MGQLDHWFRVGSTSPPFYVAATHLPINQMTTAPGQTFSCFGPGGGVTEPSFCFYKANVSSQSKLFFLLFCLTTVWTFLFIAA